MQLGLYTKKMQKKVVKNSFVLLSPADSPFQRAKKGLQIQPREQMNMASCHHRVTSIHRASSQVGLTRARPRREAAAARRWSPSVAPARRSPLVHRMRRKRRQFHWGGREEGREGREEVPFIRERDKCRRGRRKRITTNGKQRIDISTDRVSRP